jgi:hypothetical protein
LIAMRWCNTAHAQVKSCVGNVAEWACILVVCVLALRKLRGLCGIVCGLPVYFWWSVDSYLKMVVLKAQGDAVWSVAWSLPFQPSF